MTDAAQSLPTDDPFLALLGRDIEIEDDERLFVEPVEGPVEDHATDFDHTAPDWVADPYPIWEDLRQRCPVAHTERFGGGWLPVTHEGVSAVAYDTEHFTSRSIIMGNSRPPRALAPVGIAAPISADPPYHHESRRALLPAFAPKRIAQMEESMRAYCDELLDAVAGQDVVDAAVDYAQHIPVRAIADMLGLPPEDGDAFRGFVHSVLEGINAAQEDRMAGFLALLNYLGPKIEARMAEPGDDLISELILKEREEGDEPDMLTIFGTVGLLLIAGIDTTWSAIGASLWHLAGHDDDRRRLAYDRSLLPTAMEEFLRAYAPVTMARLVKEDVDFAGCPMKKDDWVLLSFPAANRDPEVFERADEVLIDRKVNRHAAFGLGIHRCAGSNLARLEIRVALEAWLDRYGDGFSLADADAVTWSAGQVRGPRHLPIRIG